MYITGGNKLSFENTPDCITANRRNIKEPLSRLLKDYQISVIKSWAEKLIGGAEAPAPSFGIVVFNFSIFKPIFLQRVDCIVYPCLNPSCSKAMFFSLQNW